MPFSFAEPPAVHVLRRDDIQIVHCPHDKPLADFASANRFDSSGESALTNVSMANRKSTLFLPWLLLGKRCSPFQPTTQAQHWIPRRARCDFVSRTLRQKPLHVDARRQAAAVKNLGNSR